MTRKLAAIGLVVLAGLLWAGSLTSDNLKVRARLTTTFADHGMQVPQLLFLKVSNELHLETDLTFVRAQP